MRKRIKKENTHIIEIEDTEKRIFQGTEKHILGNKIRKPLKQNKKIP